MAIIMHGQYHLVEFKDLQKTVHNLKEILKDLYVRKEQYEKEIEELKDEIAILKDDIKSLKDEITSLKLR